jgi:hypothetical protein
MRRLHERPDRQRRASERLPRLIEMRRYVIEVSDVEGRLFDKLALNDRSSRNAAGWSEAVTVSGWLRRLARKEIEAALNAGRRCKVCKSELPFFSRPDKEYCDDACYERGRRRKSAGLREDFLPQGCQGRALRDFVGRKSAE